MLIQINPTNPEPEKIEQVVAILQNGGIIVYPTDTIYGLGCDIFSKDAIKKIYQLKKRKGQKPMSIICADLKDAAKYAIIPDAAFKVLKKALPGPFTFILKAKSNLPTSFLSKNKTVGIRIPDNQICLEIVKTLGNPIITTSLNFSGDKVMASPSQMPLEMKNKIDLIIEAGTLEQAPSTVVDLSSGQPLILRPGKGDASPFI